MRNAAVHSVFERLHDSDESGRSNNFDAQWLASSSLSITCWTAILKVLSSKGSARDGQSSMHFNDHGLLGSIHNAFMFAT